MKINKIIIFLLIILIGITTAYAVDDNNLQEDVEPILTEEVNSHNIIQENTQSVTSNPKNNKNLKKESQTIILNSSNFDDYVTNRSFNEKVNPGDTIDIQGIFDGGHYSLNIDKPINIISSTHDAYIDVDTKSQGFYGYDAGNDFSFKISNGGSGSNITGITLHNTYIPISNAHNITITNITASCNQAVGVGTGMISIRDGSTNVNVTNGYFETFPNGGHSNVVFAYAHNCVFENNTVKGHGSVGNLVYITSYSSAEDTGETNQTYCNSNITIRNNYIDGHDATDNGICVGVVVEGANHTIVNNTILKANYFMRQVNDYGTNLANITFEDNYCPLAQIEIINITDNNYETYGTLNEDVLELNENITYKHLNIKTTRIKEICSQYPVNIIAINNTVAKLTLNYENIQVNDLYAPETMMMLKNSGSITNSTLKSVIADDSRTIISNNIIVNNGELLENHLASILLKQTNNQTIIKNNYLLAYNEGNVLCGDDAITKISGSDETLENNTPHYSNMHILNTSTYNNLFDEKGILKEEITGTIIITESISQPIIINKAINLTSPKIPDEDKQLRGLRWGKFTTDSPYCFVYPKVYRIINQCDNIMFTNGSEQSNLTNAYVETIIINNTAVNIKNNNINGTIQIINSTHNNITENNITTNGQYTIILDETSTENIIQSNYLVPCNDSLWIIQPGGFIIRNTSINTFGDLSVYNPQGNTIVNNTPLSDVNITIYCEDTIPSLPMTVKVNITCNNKTVNKGYVIVNMVNGTSLLRENLTNGYLEFNYTPTTCGNQTLKVWYYGETPYNNTVASKNITVRKSNVTLTLESENITIGETINVYATVLDEYNNPIDDEVLTFIVNKTEYKTTIHDGIATFTAKTNDTWINGVQAKFYETDKYTTATSNVIKPSKGEVIFNIRQSIEGNNLKITVYLSDIGETPVANGYIRFKNGTKTIGNSKIMDGYASCEIPLANVTNGAVILANFTNNAAFNLRAEDVILTLNPPTITQLQLDEVNGKVGQTIMITAIVTTEDNTPVNEGTVTFTTIDYNETVTVTDGTATTTHTFTQKLNDTLKAIYTPSNPDDYYESSNTTTITITKDPEDTMIILEAINAKVNQEVIITATVTTTDGTPIDTGTVTFTTTKYNETVNVTGGIATTTHTFTEVLDELLTATYTPDSTEDYNPSTNTTTINIKGLEYILKVDTTTFTSQQENIITAKIYYGEDVATNISKGKVTFKVNGKTLKDSNGKVIYAKVVNGTATIEYMIPDTWNNQTMIQAVYSGSNDCQSLKSDKQTITIEKTSPTVTFDDITATQTETIQLNIQVAVGQTPVNTGKVIVKINGKTIKDVNGKVIFATVNNGIATIEYIIPENMKANDYTLTAVYMSSNERIEETKVLTVN